MTRIERNELISNLFKLREISQDEQILFVAVSGLLGDEESIEIDYDFLEEVTALTMDGIEDLLNTMADYEVLQILDYEHNEMG